MMKHARPRRSIKAYLQDHEQEQALFMLRSVSLCLRCALRLLPLTFDPWQVGSGRCQRSRVKCKSLQHGGYNVDHTNACVSASKLLSTPAPTAAPALILHKYWDGISWFFSVDPWQVGSGRCQRSKVRAYSMAVACTTYKQMRACQRTI
jgi:hypothetical protein